MSFYLGNYDNQEYGRRTVGYRNYQKNPEKRRSLNHNSSGSKMRDNSAILRRAINKRYKEDLNKDIRESDNYDDIYDDINFDKNNNNFKNNGNYYENNNYNENNYYNNRYNDNNEYKEFDDINNNFYNYNNSNYCSNHKLNYNPNFELNYNYNSNSNFIINENENNNHIKFDKALISRINKNRRKNINQNMKNYYSTNVSKDNLYDEFIINYNSGINIEDIMETNSLNRNKTQLQFYQNRRSNINSQVYNKVTPNNCFYRDNHKSNFNNTFNMSNSQIDYRFKPKINNINEHKIPYQKRRINNYAYKGNKENGMSNENHFILPKQNPKIYPRNYTESKYIHNQNILDNLNNNYINNNNENFNNKSKEDYYNLISKSQEIYNYDHISNDLNLTGKISSFLEHVIQYCFLYYLKVIQKIFAFLKNQRNKPKINKISKINSKINKNINLKNKLLKTTKNIRKFQTYAEFPTISKKNKINETKASFERVPYHKNLNNTNVIIERIKINNQSVSPGKKNNVELFRNADELNKKSETIHNRKYRMSYNNKRNINDSSFNSDSRSFYRSSVDKNKEIFEINLNKERERRKKILELQKRKNKQAELLKQNEGHKLEIKNKDKSKEENINLSELIKKNEELKRKIKKAIEDNKLDSIKDKNKQYKNSNNNISSLERKKIREKYRKKNKMNDKYEMIDVKKLATKDKSIHINIKYLNYIPMKNKNKRDNNRKSAFYKVCNNFNISLFAVKKNTGIKKNLKSENNEQNLNLIPKLSSIQEENKIDFNDLSDSISNNSEENKK